MESEATTYAAIFKDGSFIEKDSLEEIQVARTALFFLKKEYHSQHTTTAGNVHKYFKFKPITIEGFPTVIKEGNFEIISIGPQRGDYYSGLRIPFKILELSTNVIREYTTKTKGFEVFKNEIFPLMAKLKELGTWAGYETYKYCFDLEESNKSLLELNKQLQKQLAELKVKIEAFEAGGVNKINLSASDH